MAVLRKWLTSLSQFWKNRTKIQRWLIVGISAGLLFFIILFTAVKGAHNHHGILLLQTKITNPQQLSKVTLALDNSDVHYTLKDGSIYMDNINDARRMRDLLVSQNLLPTGTDPWSLFDTEKWTTTDFERNVDLQRAITKQLQQHIMALNDVQYATVSLVIPKESLFKSDQKPTTAAVSLVPAWNSDLLHNQEEIKGIEKLIAFAVPGLKTKNIVITGPNGQVINDFAGQGDLMSIKLAQSQLKFKNQIQNGYRQVIAQRLGDIFSPSRVKVINVDVSLDMSQKNIQQKVYSPIILKAQTPGLPYNDSQVTKSITLESSTSTEHFKGNGYTPEGPPGVQSQTPPGYKDKQDMNGNYDKSSVVQHNAVNQENIQEKKAPWSINSVHIGVVLDGTWHVKTNNKGQPILSTNGDRQWIYSPMTQAQLDKVQKVIEGAFDYEPSRGDSVSVENIKFDRSAEHEKLDQQYFHSLVVKRYIFWGLISFGILVILFIVLRILYKFLLRMKQYKQERLKMEKERQEYQQKSQFISDSDLDQYSVQVSQFAKDYPKEFAQVIKMMLQDSARN